MWRWTENRNGVFVAKVRSKLTQMENGCQGICPIVGKYGAAIEAAASIKHYK